MDGADLRSTEAAGNTLPATVGPALWLDTALRMQRVQFEAWTAWLGAVAGFGQELLDGWAAHWAGGVPLDG